MIRITGFKRAFLMPSRNRGVFCTRAFGNGSFDGWGSCRGRDSIDSFLYRFDITFGNSTGITQNPSPSAFYRIHRWVKR